MRSLALEAPTAHAVLYVLLERMNQRNALVCSRDTLARITGKSRPTVTRALTELRERNIIETVVSGNMPIIVVNQRIAWATDTTLRGKLAVFDATVIVSLDEQEPSYSQALPPLVKLPPMLIPPDVGVLLDDDKDQRGQGEIDL